MVFRAGGHVLARDRLPVDWRRERPGISRDRRRRRLPCEQLAGPVRLFVRGGLEDSLARTGTEGSMASYGTTARRGGHVLMPLGELGEGPGGRPGAAHDKSL